MSDADLLNVYGMPIKSRGTDEIGSITEIDAREVDPENFNIPLNTMKAKAKRNKQWKLQGKRAPIVTVHQDGDIFTLTVCAHGVSKPLEEQKASPEPSAIPIELGESTLVISGVEGRGMNGRPGYYFDLSSPMKTEQENKFFESLIRCVLNKMSFKDTRTASKPYCAEYIVTKISETYFCLEEINIPNIINTMSKPSSGKKKLSPKELQDALKLAAKKKTPRSESSLRADELQAEVDALKLAAKKKTTKSESSLRVKRLEAELAVAQKFAKQKDNEKQRMQRELEQAKMFTEIRSNMKPKIDEMKLKIVQTYQDANSIDLVILMDCTGSMSSYINDATQKINFMVDSIKHKHADSIVRVGFVAYRDHCDGDDRIKTIEFTEDVNAVKNFIASQRAHGGGDGPEDIAGGLQAALEMDWKSDARCIVLVADSPCHKEEFHTYGSDGDSAISKSHFATDPCIKQQMKILAFNGIDFTIVEISPSETAKMVKALENSYQVAELPLDGIKRKFEAVTADVRTLSPTIISAASSSLSSSKSRSVALAGRDEAIKLAKGKLSSFHHYGPTGVGISANIFSIKEGDESKSICLTSVPIDWDNVESQPAQRAIRHSYLLRREDGGFVNWKNPSLKEVSQTTTVKVLRSSFSKGAMRTAHAMVDMNTGNKLVAKVYYRCVGSQDIVARDVQSQCIAKAISHEYSSNPSVPAIDFIFTSYYELLDLESDDPMKYFGSEPYIAGSYVKYNNNNGWKSEEFAASAQAFSHFSWQFTYGSLMVVDLQGVNYVLTDPQIHTEGDGRGLFGEGNLGDRGIASFFASHVCNSVCASLKLVPFASGEDTLCKEGVRLRHAKVESADDMCSKERQMEISCGLCGDIFQTAHGKFIEQKNKAREIYCEECAVKVSSVETAVCIVCGIEMKYSEYWYRMRGMERPKSCRTCKEDARKAAALIDSSKEK